jgi:hypothetical protein
LASQAAPVPDLPQIAREPIPAPDPDPESAAVQSSAQNETIFASLPASNPSSSLPVNRKNVNDYESSFLASRNGKERI